MTRDLTRDRAVHAPGFAILSAHIRESARRALDELEVFIGLEQRVWYSLRGGTIEDRHHSPPIVQVRLVGKCVTVGVVHARELLTGAARFVAAGTDTQAGVIGDSEA